MQGYKLSGNTVKFVVVAFSALGISVLFLIGNLSEVEMVPLSELEDHAGETVEVEGIVMGSVRYPSGSAKLLIFESNDTAEVYIETSENDHGPGCRIRVRGEVYLGNDMAGITAANDRSLEVLKGADIETLSMWSSMWEVCSLKGLVISSDRVGWDDHELVISYMEDGQEKRAGALLMELDEGPGTGDLVNVTGALGFDGDMLCYGPSSIEILNRAVPRCVSLRELVSELEFGVTSPEPRTLEGFLRYEPAGRSFYIGEAVSGSSVNIRVEVVEPVEFIHKGDLVELVNCSVDWDAASLRYHLSPEVVRLIEPYGTWHLNLGSLDYGVGEFEGCRVALDGVLQERNGTAVLQDGTRSLTVEGWEGAFPQDIVSIEGTIAFDNECNTYKLILEDGV